MFAYIPYGTLWLLVACLLTIIIYLTIEIVAHNWRLKKIAIRVHVNGTRGKSSVTRLIAAGMRAGNIITCSKTTGTVPRFIDPYGNEFPIYRPLSSNIIEQIKIIKFAMQYKPKALVIECMALQPHLQSLAELKLIKATHGVITNTRADHLDVMGPHERDVALALAGTVPKKALLFTCERRHIDALNFAAHDRNTKLIKVQQHDIDAISEQTMQRFTYEEHKENVALALKVCESAGVTKEIALDGMINSTPDVGVTTINKITFQNRKLIFINGFAANDPESSEQLWNKFTNKFFDIPCKVLIINCRADRKQRSEQLASVIKTWQAPQLLYAIGTGTFVFTNIAKNYLHNDINLFAAENWNSEQLLTHIISATDKSDILLVGLGNIAGIGLDLLEYFQKRKD